MFAIVEPPLDWLSSCVISDRDIVFAIVEPRCRSDDEEDDDEEEEEEELVLLIQKTTSELGWQKEPGGNKMRVDVTSSKTIES